MATYIGLMEAGIIEEDPWEKSFYELALKITGAVQAKRWTLSTRVGVDIFIHLMARTRFLWIQCAR